MAALHEHAGANLRFIRDTMASASAFTGVSGPGNLLAGLSALAAQYLAERQGSEEAWLAVWLAELVLAASLLLLLTARKARRQGLSLGSHAGRKLLLAFTPPLAVGGLLTLALFRAGQVDLLPGTWLSLYGAGVICGGLFSVPLVPLMGAAFMALGAVALLFPALGGLMTALGFGGLHLLFGVLFWRRHGG